MPNQILHYGYTPSGGTGGSGSTGGSGMIGNTGGTGGIGARGESFNIDRHSIILSESELASIETTPGISPLDVFIVTIFKDNRVNKNSPIQLQGDMSRHILMYNGFQWYDWGIFIGDTGGTGGTGFVGGTGGTGRTGDIGMTLTGGSGGTGGSGRSGPRGLKGNTGGSGGTGSTGSSGSGIILATSQYRKHLIVF